jgi:hypothetical protein
MNDKDQRIYRTMVEHLDRYERGELAIGQLIPSLDALVALLDETDEEWSDAFRYEWGTLETVYAIALDKGTTQLPSEGQLLIDRAIESMRRLLDRKRGA